MEVKKLNNYNIAKYPQGYFKHKRINYAGKIARISAAYAAMIAFIQGCTDNPITGSGTTGPPPVTPDMITEQDARLVIEEVFSQNNVSLERDKYLSFAFGDNDPVRLNLDGYNDSLRVGYEYIANVDEDNYIDSLNFYEAPLQTALEEAINDTGPYIKVTNAFLLDNEDGLEELMQTFIDSLKANGVI